MNNFPSSLRCFSIALGGLLFAASIPRAGIGDQIETLLAMDGAVDDLFGQTVAISGPTAIVGAIADDDNGDASGSAYLFDAESGTQLAKLLPTDGQEGDLFGTAVAISGTTAIVSAYADDDNGDASGSAYLFDTGSGMQLFKLLADDAADGDIFGQSVAISGTTAIVGAPGNDDLGDTSGAAYLFDTVTGLQLAKLLPNDGSFGDRFGCSVGISGTTAIVGADHAGLGTDSGAAYLFDTGTGQQIVKLLPSGGGPVIGNFGVSVAISGSTAIVGALYDGDTADFSGAAYLFDAVTGAQITRLIPSDAAPLTTFGATVAINGLTAIVGATGNFDNGPFSGSAYIFDVTTGREMIKLLPDVGEPGDVFGGGVGISGTAIVIGASQSFHVPAEKGVAYLFEGPTLTSETSSISLSTGGTHALLVDGGIARANWPYFMFGSVSGTSPGIDFGGGVVLPLNFDIYMNLTLFKPGLAAFGAFRGTLDGTGKTVASITLPPLMDPSLVGVTLNHAYLAAAVLGVPDFASNAVPVMLVP